MLTGYRTYIAAAVIIIHQILNAFGFTEVTGESLSVAVDVILAIFVFIFRKLSNKPVTP